MSEKVSDRELKEINKKIGFIYENYICDPDVYKYAYENCKEYRRYINSLPESTMQKIKKVHAANTVSKGVHNFRKGVLHACTGGVTLLAEKALFKSKKQKVKELVNSEEFASIFTKLYISGL